MRRETHGGPCTVKSQNLCAPFFEPRRNIVENLASDMSFERSRRAAAAIGVSARIHHTLGTATHIHAHKSARPRLFVYKATVPYSHAISSFLFFFIHANGFHTALTRQKILFFYSPFLFFLSAYTYNGSIAIKRYSGRNSNRLTYTKEPQYNTPTFMKKADVSKVSII